MKSGPSKEDLDMYWKSSRPYFDELANHYKTADPEYYKKYIAPFYRFGTTSQQSGSKTSSPVLVVVISVALLLIGLIAGIVMLLLG
jgi:hypothetical protein